MPKRSSENRRRVETIRLTLGRRGRAGRERDMNALTRPHASAVTTRCVGTGEGERRCRRVHRPRTAVSTRASSHRTEVAASLGTDDVEHVSRRAALMVAGSLIALTPLSARADDAEDADDPPPPTLTPEEQAALDKVNAAVQRASEDSIKLASPTAPNQYLPIPQGFSLPLPPDPVRFPRAPLDIKLAVLLLRSTYETVDAMDVMAMDTFQINFWKSRQSEWEPYTQQYSPLKIEQGKLTDPLYFDFISYTQFKVVSKEIPRSQSVFEERSGAEGTTKVVRRDATLSDNKVLPAVLAQRLGDTIYARVRYGFEGTDFDAPEPSFDGDVDSAVGGMRKLVNSFVRKGYALKSAVDVVNNGVGDKQRVVTIRLDGPATLWSAQALAARGVTPSNEYLGYTLTGYLRLCGVPSVYSTKVNDTAVELEFVVG